MASRQDLPEVVKQVRALVAMQPPGRLTEISAKLIDDTPDCIQMWQAIARHVAQSDDDLWVWAFLRATSHASDLPPFHYKSKRDRADLAARISTLATDLCRALKVNRLDVHIVKSDSSVNFPGFRVYEDFSEPNQARINQVGEEKLKVTDLIRAVVARSQKAIEDEPAAGKSGVNVRAIRFMRIMAKRSRMIYGGPLNLVIATAANLLFGTKYTEADVTKLKR